MDLTDKKVLFIIAPKNFRDEELLGPRRILEGYKAKTLVASNVTTIINGMLGTKVTPSVNITNVKVNDYDAIIFVGGSGSSVYFNDKVVLNIAKEANLKGKILASICLASGILANAGIFKGKDATGWPDTKEMIEKNGGIYTNSDLEVSGRIISAKGPNVAKKFGEAIAKALESSNKGEDEFV